MPTLDVPGASLYYETRGSGPLFLLIPGGGGSGGLFRTVSVPLSSKYTVVTYDRRGFSRSTLTAEQDYSVRLQTDVDDAHALIKHLSPAEDGTAVVYGSSSGAIVALFLLLSYPESIRKLIPHEPPVYGLVPDGDEWIKFNHACYDTFKAEGPTAAHTMFLDHMSGGMELQMFKQRLAMRTEEQKKDTESLEAKNQAYWFEHELRQYPAAKLDVDALAKHQDKLILAAGKDSEGLFPYRPISNLSKQLGLPLLELPGAHVGFLFTPESFAKVLIEALEKQ